MKKIILSLLALLVVGLNALAENPKREFRGAWIHVVGPIQWMNKTPQQQKAFIDEQVRLLDEAGCNAMIFQIRPAADALYKSDLEPWSKYLTGKRGKAPSDPDWDPLAYAVKKAHEYGMELHAWINPYRVTLGAEELGPDHDSKKHPERYFKYDGKVFFDPAYQENRDFITKVVKDIITRYDVDAIHMDDYFYPYPSGSKLTGDDESYAQFGGGMNRGDWRRKNVDMLIEQLYREIKSTKPWVRFGISPFGIWRNKKNDPNGSDSSGLQNYDDLYADVILWMKNGWVDYVAPQLYWQLDHKVAPSRKLAKWWSDNANGVDVYIGQDTQRTMNTSDPGANSPDELGTKIKLSRELPNVQGNIWWHGYWVTENYKGVKDKLQSNYQSTLALAPVYGDPSIQPKSVDGLKFGYDNDLILVTWNPVKNGSKARETDVVKYVVYEFYPGEDSNNLENAETIITITPFNSVEIGSKDEKEELTGRTYVVTAIDRMNRESKPMKITL